MQVTFDPAKDAENIRKHRISLQRAEDFDVDTAYFAPERSQHYAEERWKGIGWIGAAVYTIILVFEATSIRAISLRKATREERKEYAESNE